MRIFARFEKQHNIQTFFDQMYSKLTRLFIIILCTITISVNGQKQVNSPYSRFNLGTMEPAGSFRSLGMGGVSTGMRDHSSIFFSNPASYSSIDTNSFVFDFGIDYSMNFMSNGTMKHSSDDINFDHLLMGFPIAKGWGFAAGIYPISNGYYSVFESVKEGDPDYNATIGEYTSLHKGSGGLNAYFLGTGIKLMKNLSAGINMTVLSGDLTRVNDFAFADYYYVYNDKSAENLHMSGVNFEYGFQYSTEIKNKYFFNLGASLTTARKYNTDFQSLIYRYTAYSTVDTISYENSNNRASLPQTIRAGISFGKINKFTAGIDYSISKWSKAIIPGSEGFTADTKTLQFGAEYIPDMYSNYSLLKRLEYRIGGHVGDNYLILNGEQVKEYGASLGIGIPLRKSFNKANLFVDFTNKKGSGSATPHSENYITFGISLNLYDFWFLQRKYD